MDPQRILLANYFAGHPHLADVPHLRASAAELLVRVNALLEQAAQAGVRFSINPRTLTIIAGEKNGGIRPGDSKVGAAMSAHKAGMAVDVYDPKGNLDSWLTDKILLEHNLYREHQSATPTWTHLQTRPPASGKRTFFP